MRRPRPAWPQCPPAKSPDAQSPQTDHARGCPPSTTRKKICLPALVETDRCWLSWDLPQFIRCEPVHSVLTSFTCLRVHTLHFHPPSPPHETHPESPGADPATRDRRSWGEGPAPLQLRVSPIFT